MRNRRLVWWLLASWLVAAAPLAASVAPSGSPVREKSFRDPDLFVRVLERPVADLDAALASELEAQLASLGASRGLGFYDWRAGGWGSLVLSVPLLPGDGRGSSPAQVWAALWRFLAEHREQLRVEPGQLGTPRVSIQERGDLIYVHVPRVVGGVAVRDSGLSAVLNHGNLVLLGLQGWGAVKETVNPGVTASKARAATEAHLKPFAVSGYRDEGHLELLPMARGDEVAEVTRGQGCAYRLAWVVGVDVAGDLGRWEALVDAASGKLLGFQDTNQYAVRRVVGGVYPVSNDQRPPDGIEQPFWPMPFANITSGSGPFTTTSAGIVPGCVNGSMTTTLNGQFIRITDLCGPVNESSAADIDLGASGGDDCVVPAGHSAGDTHSARTAFYELNRIKEQARGYLPGNVWLTQQLNANVNINQSCGAFWDGTAVNTFRSGSGCGNPGEIAGVLDHEWGHGLDDNGTNGSISSPGEAIADINAILRLSDSCVGRGFLQNQVCGGYGDECDGTPATGCTGARDSDWLLHRCDRPHDIDWILNGFMSAECNNTGPAPACSPGGQTGPCGRETHCEGQIVAEVAWDLQFRDLSGGVFNYDSNTALELTTRLMYLAPQVLTSWFTCGAGCQPAGTCGCGATGGYLLTLATDDDNGNIADGTPHMSAIRAAFERHGIHCGAIAVADSGCAGGPASAPSVVAAGGPGFVSLSWGPVAGAASYNVYKTEGVFACDFGKVLIGNTAGTSFVDTAVLDGRQYSYGVMPLGSNTSCFGPMSACASATPSVGTDPCGPPPLPDLSIGDVAMLEGNGGTTNFLFPVTLSAPSGSDVTAAFSTQDGSATVADNDYLPLSGNVIFAPGETLKNVTISVVGDFIYEPDEVYFVSIGAVTGANVLDGIGDGLVINDDEEFLVSRTELIHGSKLGRDLASTGGSATQDFFAIRSQARRSWEVVVDGTGGDLGTSGPSVVRLDSDGATVLQASVPIGAGSSRSLSWENAGAADFDGFVRVESNGCTTTCTAEDVYRIRALDTTYAISRLNNSATQTTVVIVQNTSGDAVTGTIWLWSAAGALVATQPMSLAPRAVFVLNTAAVAPGVGGSMTVSHNGRYGSLQGKAVAVEPATGFTFDTPMVLRDR